MEKRKVTDEEIDTIGEIMNISMGASATAVSTMLERQVTITTPQIEVGRFSEMDYSYLEPAIIVKINYIEGLKGTSVILLRRNDMRIILELLMKNDFSEMDDEFEFDDMSMSAACEVMNQMMGSSATALSELLGVSVNISTPQAALVDTSEEAKEMMKDLSEDGDDNVMSISFNMSISGTLDTKFSNIMPLEFVKGITSSLQDEVREDQQPVPLPVQQQDMPLKHAEQQARQEAYPVGGVEHYQPPQAPYIAGQPQQNYQNPQQPYPPQTTAYSQQNMQTASGNGYYPPQYGDYQMPNPGIRYTAPMVNVKQADFPELDGLGNVQLNPKNVNVLMGVQLEVSVIVGRAKHKIKDLLEFGQGAVIELDKQTGSPAEIMVNGQLLAYGDVVVVGDNFGVRITEIVGTKKLIDSLDKK